MDKLNLPEGVTYLQAYGAVMAKKLLSETDFDQYCRKNGILSSSVSEWEQWFEQHPDAKAQGELQVGMEQPNIKTIAAMLEAERSAIDPSVKRYSDVEEALRALKA